MRDEALIGFTIPGVKEVDVVPVGWVKLGQRLSMTEKGVLFKLRSAEIWLPKRLVVQLKGKQEWFTTTWAIMNGPRRKD